MGNFSESYLGQLRKVIGSRLVLMPGTRIVIENESGNILLDLRADFRIWALPGGACEPDEGAEETIIREVAGRLNVGARDAFRLRQRSSLGKYHLPER